MIRKFALFLALSTLAACGQKRQKPHFTVTSIEPNHAGNYGDARITILGSGFAKLAKGGKLPSELVPKKKGGTRFELWQGSSDRLGKGLSLEKVQVVSDRILRATVHAGAPAGKYHLVIRRGLSMEFTKVPFLVTQRTDNAGPPRILHVMPERIRAGIPERVVITGANLHGPVSVSLVGPLPEHLGKGAAAADLGIDLPWPLRNSAPRELLRLSEENPARISATLPPNLPAGRYAFHIQTESHSGHPRDLAHLLTIQPKPPGMSEAMEGFLIYFGVMGFVFLVGLIYAYRQGDVGWKTKHERLGLAWMLGGLAFYLVLIGGLQFWASHWY